MTHEVRRDKPGEVIRVRGTNAHQAFCNCGWEGELWNRKATAETDWYLHINVDDNDL